MTDGSYYTWEYQESVGLYHIFPSNDVGYKMICHGSLYLEAPREEANDEAVEEIVSSLESIAVYNYGETGFRRVVDAVMDA